MKMICAVYEKYVCVVIYYGFQHIVHGTLTLFGARIRETACIRIQCKGYRIANLYGIKRLVLMIVLNT